MKIISNHFVTFKTDPKIRVDSDYELTSFFKFTLIIISPRYRYYEYFCYLGVFVLFPLVPLFPVVSVQLSFMIRSLVYLNNITQHMTQLPKKSVVWLFIFIFRSVHIKQILKCIIERKYCFINFINTNNVFKKSFKTSVINKI